MDMCAPYILETKTRVKSRSLCKTDSR